MYGLAVISDATTPDIYNFWMHLLAPTPVSGWVSQSVIDSFRFGDSYRILDLCKLVFTGPEIVCQKALGTLYKNTPQLAGGGKMQCWN